MPTDATTVRLALGEALEGRLLLSHPFYRRWEQGLLEPEELTEYAGQYRHVEAALPEVLESIVEEIEPGRARDLLEANLADERGEGDSGSVPHTALFERFASAVSASPGLPASPATSDLVLTQKGAARRSPCAAIATLAAYEVQAAEVASTKSESLRRHYGLGRGATEFWDLHAEVEGVHGAWSVEALSSLGTDPGDVRRAARAAAAAWWAMLDEREARRQPGAMPSSTSGRA